MPDAPSRYTGRFAPSPTGPLHAGSLAAALASWLDARAHHGRWLVRIEDIDPPRCQPGADERILGQLHALGLAADAPPAWQSRRTALYQAALERLAASGMAYPCGCTRRDIESAIAARQAARPRHAERVYPGTCRHGLHGKPARAWRVLTTEVAPGRLPPASPGEPPVRIWPDGSGADGHAPGPLDQPARWMVAWRDRRLGPQRQDLTRDVGDFVLRRADGLWAYQLAVVVDDGEQGITHVVRGADLTDNTPRQLWLQRLLGLPHPAYLHVPLVLDAQGEKLSKQHGAPAVDTGSSRACRLALEAAAQALGLPPALPDDTPAQALVRWTGAWAAHGMDSPEIK